LEKRREIGVIFTDDSVIREMISIFERDWSQPDSGGKDLKKDSDEAKAPAAVSQ
jgi:hypothetical protein